MTLILNMNTKKAILLWKFPMVATLKVSRNYTIITNFTSYNNYDSNKVFFSFVLI